MTTTPSKEGARVGIEIDDKNWRGVKAAALHAADAALPKNSKATMTLLLTSDKTMRKLNQQWRQKDYVTNVLSFPAPELKLPRGTPQHLGDIAIGFGIVQREAKLQGKKPLHHLQHLIVHGILHLLGYDHENDADAEKMERKERLILKKIDVPDPYKI